MSGEPQSYQKVHFDPDLYPDNTLKAFNEFIQIYELRYDALYPDPPKVSLDSAIQKWRIENTTNDDADPKPSLPQYNAIITDWRAKDRVAKLLGMFSSNRLYLDWCQAEPNEATRKADSWDNFKTKMKELYKPTANDTLRNFHFRQLQQQEDEPFIAFCNRVTKEAIHCNLKCHNVDCTSESTNIRDQINIGMTENSIRQESMKLNWNLDTLRRDGMAMESSIRGGAELAGEKAINKVGKYAFRKTKFDENNSEKTIECFNCGGKVTGSIYHHKSKICPARKATCKKCGRIGHYDKCCRSKQRINIIRDEEEEKNDNANGETLYSFNLFMIQEVNKVQPSFTSRVDNRNDFKAQVVVNNHLGTVIADTGARVSVCGMIQARRWGLLDRMVRSKTKIKPYNSTPIPVYGEAKCAVTLGSTSIPVTWHILSGSCEPILSGDDAVALGLIQFNKTQYIFNPISMVYSVNVNAKERLQACLVKYQDTFTGVGKLKGHQVKLHVDHTIKPVVEPQRSVPYHLKERGSKVLEGMMNDDLIEEHPAEEPAPWISNATFVPKAGSVRVTLDARNVNKAIQSTNLPIPRHEDIKAKLAGCKYFSKLDFKSAFWQIELAPESRYLTVFHANDKLLRYKRLVMGLKPAQGELNSALRPIFSHIQDVYLIHDDLIIATMNEDEHIDAVENVMEAIATAGLTLNGDKMSFRQK